MNPSHYVSDKRICITRWVLATAVAWPVACRAKAPLLLKLTLILARCSLGGAKIRRNHNIRWTVDQFWLTPILDGAKTKPVITGRFCARSVGTLAWALSIWWVENCRPNGRMDTLSMISRPFQFFYAPPQRVHCDLADGYERIEHPKNLTSQVESCRPIGWQRLFKNIFLPFLLVVHVCNVIAALFPSTGPQDSAHNGINQFTPQVTVDRCFLLQ